jgi:putative nucleotidyltransferase with HDIG domain
MCIKAAGIILYRATSADPVFLVLENAKHGTWGFPKGHLDGNESLEEGAIRECREETGRSVSALDPGFLKRTEHLTQPKGVGPFRWKHTHYFLAPAEDGEVRLSPEHARFVWESRLEARERLQYDSLRELLDCAFSSVAKRLSLPHGDVENARRLLDACSQPEDLWRRHCLKVSEVSRRMAEGLVAARPELPVDPDFVEAAGLLHDIGRSRGHGMDHPRVGMEILMREGLGHLAKPCLSHWLKGRKREDLEKEPWFTPERLNRLYARFDLDYISLSEKIVSTADSLVQQDRPVRLEARYEEARKRYGDSKWMRDNESITAGFIREFEQYLGTSLYSLLSIT